ncbi:muconolactone Delta-isomerase [Ensifer sp. 1H6]|uniref:muconolactone Delta-isomerase n=1 Tax=Ensifer sp. 1H6 TaxID=1911585 RepID=UPI00046C9B40|nr:muconolactone Delta-isomerase [Ensifer sp. 1H6]OMQ42756.1 muconolactone delta-isomerase [Ensifer sp. 1H6]
MLFQVRMDVSIPRNLAPEEVEDIVAKERAYSQEMQHGGKWRHIWRIVGEYANYSIFDVRDNDELHQILSGLPLFKFMTITVTPLVRHPSSIRDDDS